VLIISILAIVFIAIMAWFVSQMPEKWSYPSTFGQLGREIADAVSELFGRPRVTQLHVGQPTSRRRSNASASR
jgi:hypothetical protein